LQGIARDRHIENVFPYNPTTSNLFYPGNPESDPLNNGLGKVDWNLNDHNHLSGFYFDSRSVQQSGGTLQPYWSATGSNKTRKWLGLDLDSELHLGE